MHFIGLKPRYTVVKREGKESSRWCSIIEEATLNYCESQGRGQARKPGLDELSEQMGNSGG